MIQSNYNVAIIGAGPAGIFAALEIMKLKPPNQRRLVFPLAERQTD